MQALLIVYKRLHKVAVILRLAEVHMDLRQNGCMNGRKNSVTTGYNDGGSPPPPPQQEPATTNSGGL